jgi:hypothetical protein
MFEPGGWARISLADVMASGLVEIVATGLMTRPSGDGRAGGMRSPPLR